MKASEWKRAAQPIAEALPGHRPFRFGFVRGDEWVIAGYYADSSALSSDAFYVQAFAMPSFVLTDSLYFDYGFRINDRWDEVRPELTLAVTRSEPELAKLASLDGLAAASSDWKRNLHHTQLRLGLAVLRRDDRGSATTLKGAEGIAPQVAWESEIRRRFPEFGEVVSAQGFSAGEAVLAKRRETVDRLFAK